jgi:hypothetical protein
MRRPWHFFHRVSACTYESGRQPLNSKRKEPTPMRLRINIAAALIIATATLASLGRAQSAGYPPERLDVTFVLDPSDPGVGTSACAFPVQIHITGKSKTISLPGNRMVITAPGQRATVTNLSDPSKQVTLNTTGVFTILNQPDGGFVGIGTGRNLVTDPTFGLTLVIGRFSFAVNSSGTLIQGLTLQGGTMSSVCSMID